MHGLKESTVPEGAERRPMAATMRIESPSESIAALRLRRISPSAARKRGSGNVAWRPGLPVVRGGFGDLREVISISADGPKEAIYIITAITK